MNEMIRIDSISSLHEHLGYDDKPGFDVEG
ncbi:hypothetical protein SAMN05518670_2488 [Paenibacillus sp. OK076]|nr:hypothetical protein SAMN05518670_2488 [Paenibacillus sp. OK076]